MSDSHQYLNLSRYLYMQNLTSLAHTALIWTRPFLGTEKPRIFSACSHVVAKWQKHSEMNFTNYIDRNENNNILINYSIVL